MTTTELLLALVGGLGVHLVYTAVVFGWKGIGLGPTTARRRMPLRRRADDWLVQAGLVDVDIREVVVVVGALFALGAVLAFALFGGVLPALAVGTFTATFPLAAYRERRRTRRARARDAWPRMLEELRLLTGSAGRSIPQALFEVGANGPEELRHGFDAAHREWLISTDFARTLGVLKAQLSDATADAVAETLLVAHELGGTDLESRLASLIDDRVQDLQGRKNARSRQAGARYARWFVIAVPIGMALAGMSIGDGRAAYATPTGQALVVFAIAMVVGCWAWASHYLSLPPEERVFAE